MTDTLPGNEPETAADLIWQSQPVLPSNINGVHQTYGSAFTQGARND